jgi:hypothetical protein
MTDITSTTLSVAERLKGDVFKIFDQEDDRYYIDDHNLVFLAGRHELIEVFSMSGDLTTLFNTSGEEMEIPTDPGDILVCDAYNDWVNYQPPLDHHVTVQDMMDRGWIDNHVDECTTLVAKEGWEVYVDDVELSLVVIEKGDVTLYMSDNTELTLSSVTEPVGGVDIYRTTRTLVHSDDFLTSAEV